VAITLTVANQLIVTPATTATVPATSDPWLAGMPDGSHASLTDTAPAQSPLLVSGLALSPGEILVFPSVTGHTATATGGTPAGPNGGTAFANHVTLFGSPPRPDHGAENGISGLTAPFSSLIGVFLGPDQTDQTPAPGFLDFSPSGNVPGGLDYQTLAPQLKQVFIIGDGHTSQGALKRIVVPAGATRLFLGITDNVDWRDDTSSFAVTIQGILSPSGPQGTPAQIDYRLPSAGYTVDPASLNPSTTSVSSSDVVWNGTLPLDDATPQHFQLSGQVTNLAPGEVRQIGLGTPVTAAVQAGGSTVPFTVALPPVVVAAQHIISLTPAAQTARRNGAGDVHCAADQPAAHACYLSPQPGRTDGDDYQPGPSVQVAAGGTVNLPLQEAYRPAPRRGLRSSRSSSRLPPARATPSKVSSPSRPMSSSRPGPSPWFWRRCEPWPGRGTRPFTP
jgi:hypothetical protein